MASATTVKVSKNTRTELEKIRDRIRARSFDETIRALIKKHRNEVLREAFAADRGKIKRFTEEDRAEDR